MTTGKKDSATMEGMPKKPPSLSSRRVVLLLQQIIAEGGGRDQRGAQAYAAERTGLKADHVTKLLKGERNAGRDTIDAVRERIGLRADFFFRELEVTPFYRDWLETREAGAQPAAVSPSTYDESVAEVFDMMRATPRERATWTKIANRFRLPQPLAPIAQAMIVAMRDGQTPQTALDTAIDATTDEKLRAQGRRPLPDDEEDEDDDRRKRKR